MVDVPRAEHGFGLFGPDFGVPEGGFCLSAFLLVERDDGVLAGRMAEHRADRWTEAWAPNLAYYEGDRRQALFGGPRLPATYLRTGEHPDDAAGRVWADQLGFPESPQLPEPAIRSEAVDSNRRPGARHWDVAFVYRVPGPPVEEVPEVWAELAYRDPVELAGEGLVMRHGDLLAADPA